MTLNDIELPDDLLWINEFDWNPVMQSTDRSLTGAMLVQEQGKLYGRPIEISGGSEAGWVSRSTVVDLLALSKIPNKVMTLTLPDLREYSVIFDRQSGSPIESQQIMPFAYPGDAYKYSLTIRMLTVEPAILTEWKDSLMGHRILPTEFWLSQRSPAPVDSHRPHSQKGC